MLSKCENCGFYVRQDDEFCLNCGLRNPGKSIGTTSFQLKRFIVFDFLATLLFFSFFAIISFPRVNLFDAFLLSIVIGSFLAAAGEYTNSYFQYRHEDFQRAVKNPNSLKTKEKIIKERVSELTERGQEIDTVLGKIKATDSRNLQEVRAKLLSAQEIVMSQLARYEMQKRKIELVRLQNGISPYLSGFQNLNESDTNRSLAKIENTRQEIDKIRWNLTLDGENDLPERVLPEKEQFLAQLEETEESCEKLREAILSLEAARALQNIQPVDENLQLTEAKDIAQATESFNIETTLTDFSESFEELEREYERLQTENEAVGKKLLET